MKTRYIHLPCSTVVFQIDTECLEISDILLALYGFCYTLEKPLTGDSILLIDVRKDKHMYRISFSDQTVTTDNPVQIIKNVIYENIRYASTVLVLHGAAVEYRKMAYLFLAPTTCGKTTLTSYLTQMGLGYITDDCLLIDRRSLCILPVNMPIHLRKGGVDVLEGLQKVPPGLGHVQSKTIDRYTYEPNNRIQTPLPIAKVFFISRNANENRVEKLAGIHAIVRLMRSYLQYHSISDNDIAVFRELVEKGCQEVRYHELDYVYTLICQEGK